MSLHSKTWDEDKSIKRRREREEDVGGWDGNLCRVIALRARILERHVVTDNKVNERGMQ